MMAVCSCQCDVFRAGKDSVDGEAARRRQRAKRSWATVILGLGMGWMQAASAATPASVDEQAIGLYEQAPADWLSNGRTYAEQRYSPLSRVDARNVSRLG